MLNFLLHIYARVFTSRRHEWRNYDAEGTRERRYGYTRGPLWVHVSAYVIRFLESMINNLATGKILIL